MEIKEAVAIVEGEIGIAAEAVEDGVHYFFREAPPHELGINLHEIDGQLVQVDVLYSKKRPNNEIQSLSRRFEAGDFMEAIELLRKLRPTELLDS